uniref:F-box protein n=4 Tax=Noccaea caerulescens TaxID=107243 RepID=A0A1J3IAB6_NOCCA
MTMEVFRDLPKELVEEEMLTRVPATYLKGLGSTCKRWNRLFNGDRRFARKHSDKAAKQFLGLTLTRAFRICPIIVYRDGKVPCLEVKTELSLVDPHSKYPGAQFDVSRVFHCDGHLLCTSVDESRFVVWNPFTGETRWFQPSYRGGKGRAFALGYGKNKSYKILSYHYGEKKDFEIYEFSSDSWRVVDDIMPVGWMLGYSGISVSLKGSTYWFGFGIDETKTVSVSLVKFDFSTEKCVLVPLPYQCKDSVFEAACVSVVKDEKLSVMLQLEKTSKTEIWVSNKIDETTTQVVSWNKVLSLDLSPDLQLCEGGTFLLDEEKKFVVISMNWMDFEDDPENKSKEMIYFVGEDNEVTQVDFGIEETPECEVVILNYVPSLVQLEQAGGKRKRGDM